LPDRGLMHRDPDEVCGEHCRAWGGDISPSRSDRAIQRADRFSTIARGLCGFSAIGAQHASPHEALARGKRCGRAAEAQKAPYALGKRGLDAILADPHFRY